MLNAKLDITRITTVSTNTVDDNTVMYRYNLKMFHLTQTIQLANTGHYNDTAKRLQITQLTQQQLQET